MFNIFKKLKGYLQVNSVCEEVKTPTIIFESEILESIINVWLEGESPVQKGFGEVLLQLGFNPNDTVVLSICEENRFSFNYSIAPDSIDPNNTISLRYGDYSDNFPEITITSAEIEKCYEHIPSGKKGSKLYLKHYALKDSKNGNNLWRHLSPYNYQVKLENGDYSFSLSIGNLTDDTELDFDGNRNVFRLRNEDSLEKYLLGLQFPFAIDEVYKTICELSLDSITQYQKVELKVSRKTEKENITTDFISLQNRQSTDLIIIRNGKTISLDAQNNWLYQTPEFSVNKYSYETVSYSVKSVANDQIGKGISPLEQIDTAQNEVAKARRLMKIPFSANNQ